MEIIKGCLAASRVETFQGRDLSFLWFQSPHSPLDSKNHKLAAYAPPQCLWVPELCFAFSIGTGLSQVKNRQCETMGWV